MARSFNANMGQWCRLQIELTIGRFILTGSQNVELLNRVSQSLAGRTAIVRLLPLSLREIQSFQPLAGMDPLIYTGGYPGIHDRKLNPTEALSFYFSTYVERD